jgi:hypothetical protein
MKHLNFFTRRILPVIAICAISYFANAQAPASAAKPVAAAPKGAMSYIDMFFKKYKTSPDSAIDYIFATNKLFTNLAQINAVKAKLDSGQAALGKYLGKELISQKSVSPGFVGYTYLAKHENEPIRFTFIFYKPQNEWILYRFNFDDAIDTELFDALKIRK